MQVGPFGPLYDGAVVPFANLAQQVRATAVNASLRMRKQKGLNFKGRSVGFRQLAAKWGTECIGIHMNRMCYQTHT